MRGETKRTPLTHLRALRRRYSSSQTLLRSSKKVITLLQQALPRIKDHHSQTKAMPTQISSKRVSLDRQDSKFSNRRKQQLIEFQRIATAELPEKRSRTLRLPKRKGQKLKLLTKRKQLNNKSNSKSLMRMKRNLSSKNKSKL